MNHATESAYLLIVIQGVQLLKTYALSLAVSVISATLKHPIFGFTRLRIVDIIDQVKTNYGVLSRSDLVIFDTRLTTYTSLLNLAQNFTISDATHELATQRAPTTCAGSKKTRQSVYFFAIQSYTKG